jgi:hypothetical protein
LVETHNNLSDHPFVWFRSCSGLMITQSIFWIDLSILVEIHMLARWFLLLHTTFQKVNSLSSILHSPCSLDSLLLAVWIIFPRDNSLS